MVNDKPVTLTQEELQDIIDRAAEAGAEIGARKALASIGLGDENAGEDVRDLRSLLAAWRVGKKTAFRVVVQNLTNLAFIALLIGIAVKVGGIKLGGAP